ncbi:hypothetical protein ABG067_007022 [Albugo candida]
MSSAPARYSNLMLSIAPSMTSSPNRVNLLNRVRTQTDAPDFFTAESAPTHCILPQAPDEKYTVYTITPSFCETPHSASQSEPKSCPLTSPDVKVITPPKHSALNPSALHSDDSSFKKKGTRRGTLNAQAKNILKAWMFSPEHFIHPYPNEEEKEKLVNETGIDMKQLSNWFTNARKRLWQPVLRQSGVEVKRFLSTGRGGPRGGNPPVDILANASTSSIPLQPHNSSSIHEDNSHSDHNDTPLINVSTPISNHHNESFPHVYTTLAENLISSSIQSQTPKPKKNNISSFHVHTPNTDTHIESNASSPNFAWSPQCNLNILNRKRPLTRPLAPISHLISRNDISLEPKYPQPSSINSNECFATCHPKSSMLRKNEKCDRFQDLEVLAVCSLLRLNQQSIPLSHYCDRVRND